MEKKPLIGVSICAVVLLVLGSLSNVVGYQSVKSTVSDSPLFQTRTQKAINKNSQSSLATEYLNKGKNILTFPESNRNNALFQKLIDKISMMNDKSFNNFIVTLLNQMSYRNLLEDINFKEIIIAFHQIRDNPNIVWSYLNQEENDNTHEFSTSEEYKTICKWFPGCLLIMSILRIMLTLLVQIVNIMTALQIGQCFTNCCTIDHWCTSLPGS